MSGSAGRILGLDYGMRRVGMAITDPSRSMVFPRPVLVNTGEKALFEALKVFCENEGISLIVVGYPYDDAHVENAQTQRMKDFGTKLSAFLGIPVEYEDEKYTTAEAEALLDSSGYDYKEKKLHRDGIAAMIILQSYISRLEKI